MQMADVNHYRSATLESLRWTAADVTPNDAADLAKIPAVIVPLVSGNIKVTTSGGSTVTLYGNAGFPLPVFVDRVWATGTAATGIVALYG